MSDKYCLNSVYIYSAPEATKGGAHLLLYVYELEEAQTVMQIVILPAVTLPGNW